MRPPLPPRVLEKMAANLGLITQRDLLALGCQASVISGWVRRGALEAMERGVYRLPGGYVPPLQELLAAILRCGEGARAAAGPSLALQELEGFRGAERAVVIPRPRHLRQASLDFPVTSIPLPVTDRTSASGVPVLSVTRALIEVAPQVPEKTLRVAFDDGRRRRLTSVALLRRRATALRTRHGARIALRLLGDGG